jgi:hypothetical protein
VLLFSIFHLPEEIRLSEKAQVWCQLTGMKVRRSAVRKLYRKKSIRILPNIEKIVAMEIAHRQSVLNRVVPQRMGRR